MTDAGWFPDPADPTMLRYWDGAAWTTQRRERSDLGPSTPPPPVAAGPPSGQPWGAAIGVAATSASPPRRRRRRWAAALYFLVALAVLSGAGFAGWRIYNTVRNDNDFARPGVVIVDGRGDGSAALDDVTGVLARHGITCAAASAPESHAELTDFALELERRATEAPGDHADVDRWVGALVKAIDGFEPNRQYLVWGCGPSLLIVDGDRVRMGFFDHAQPSAVSDVAELGLHLASLAPPPMSEILDALDRRGETCMATSTTVARDVLVAELLPRLAPADGSAPTAAAVAEQQAIQQLPDTDLTVRNCTNSRVIGVGSTAQLVVLGAGAPPLGDGFGGRYRLTIVGP